MKKALIIGIGNGFRKDDGIGLEIARLIKERDYPDLSVMESTGDITNYIDDFNEFELLIIADSIKNAADPGMSVRIDISELTDDFKLSPNISTHWPGIFETLKLASNIGVLPPKTIIFGVAGIDFSNGIGISPILSGSIQSIVDEIICEISI